jgi:uncharacterized damage-inducible protein DinB
MSANSSAVAFAETLPAEQIAEATRYLHDTRNTLVDSVVGLSAQQWDFKPSADCWSIAEIVEHVVLIERRVHIIVGGMANNPPPPPDWDQTEMDKRILKEVPNRSAKFTAPPFVNPSQHWSRTEGLEHFFNSREQTVQLLSASSLRGHVLPHPVLGPWDGYHWLVAAGAHSLRHTGQIVELKASPNFP